MSAKRQEPGNSEDPVESTEKIQTPSAPPRAGDLTPEEIQERYVRLSADFENFRKRAQKEKAELILYANEGLVAELLPVLDNFERAAEHAKKTTDLESIRKGIELILSQIKGAMARHGLRSDSALGKSFDPLVHEAVSHVSSSEHPPNSVIEEHQRAYYLHQRLVRPALVTVSKENETASDEGPELGLQEGQDK